jgi:trehalose 6-phosphate phosphatase
VGGGSRRLRDDRRTYPGSRAGHRRGDRQRADLADRAAAAVRAMLADHPDRLKVTSGKMVYELQPKIDWNKGRAVLYLTGVLGLNSEDVVPLYLGDDTTDEDAFRALRGRGIGIIVGRPDDPEVADRATAAQFVLASTEEVERFLARLAC